ncbi:hypothetical protein BV22DRAFT_1133216 [Leucogyrophana mollusca]|uniref:Uncharacterized protein n=1 Tax=Leucogyrophana mollusca TaxID=85980 RepID=A0ACB8B4F3_9AGAM|nr:hypothetical protein BV22DRAFT_1133216 [Leucogyrophana mollusca]
MARSPAVDEAFYSRSSTPNAIVFFALTVSLGIISAILVVTRVFVHQRRLNSVFGPGHASPYMRIAAMTIESSGLYVSWAVLFLVLYAVDSPVQSVFLASLCQIQIIAPLLIIFCVSQGKAWMHNADSNSAVVSDLRFATSTAPLEEVGSESETIRAPLAIHAVFRSPTILSVKPLTVQAVHHAQ